MRSSCSLLKREQIEEYLTSAGEELAGVRKAFYEDKVLQELATTPLMLSMLEPLPIMEVPVETFTMMDSSSNTKAAEF